VLEPAIAYARDGYPLVERRRRPSPPVEQLFRKHWADLGGGSICRTNEVLKPGTLFTNKKPVRNL